MVKLSSLLWIDEQFAVGCALGISDSLGDRYLLELNPIFSRLRKLVNSCGARFSSEATASWNDYQNAPLFCLDELLSSGTIPYVTNARTLRRITAITPSVEVSATTLLTLLKKNVILHESAHLCSYRTLKAYFGPCSSKEDFVERALLGESFANMIEQLTTVYADHDMHRLFLSFNSYISRTKADVEILRTSILIVGIQDVMRLGLIVYLYLNSHNTTINADFIHKTLRFTLGHYKLTCAEHTVLEILVDRVFHLNYAFRSETNPLFFSLHSSLVEFRSFSATFTEPLKLNKRIISIIDALVDLVFPTQDKDLYLPALRQDSTEDSRLR